MKKKLTAILLVFVFWIAACMPSQASVDAIVQATLQALTAQAQTATGSISGSLNYPSSFIPPLRVVAYLSGTSQYFYLDTIRDQATYQIDNLPAGTYHVVAYSGLAAGFSQAVPCGLSVDCTDHSLIDVNVSAGQVTANVNPFDWYAPEGAFPPMPPEIALPIAPTDVIPTTTPPAAQTGSLAGTLSYPAEGLPAMAVVAFHSGGGQNDYYYVLTIQGQSTYQIDDLPVGNYHVVAYTMGGGGFPAGLAGGYTQFVICGMQQACIDHALVDATVNAGQVTGNIDPQDWYAPDGSLPAYPLP